MTLDLEKINAAIQAAYVVPPPQIGVDLAGEAVTIRMAAPGELTVQPSDEQIAAMQARIVEDTALMLAEHRAQEERERQGWRPDPHEPDVEIKVERIEVEHRTEIRVRFQPRTGEPLRQAVSSVDDETLATVAGSMVVNATDNPTDHLLNEHIRMTVDRLCEERRQAEYERQRAARQRLTQDPSWAYTLPSAYNIYTTSNATNTLQYDWRLYTTGTTIANNTWYTGTIAGTYASNWQTKPLTPEQIAAAKAAQEKWLAEEKQRQAELAAAEEIAEKLLLDVIGRHRFRVWKKNGVVHVSSRKYKNLRYEIKAGAKIKLLQREGVKWRMRKDSLCIHPAVQHPRGDEVATLYALASFDEDALWKTANWHGKGSEPALELAA